MLAQCTAAKLGDVTCMSSRTRSYANVGESWYVGMSYVAMSHVACRNLAMSNNLHTAIQSNESVRNHTRNVRRVSGCLDVRH